MVDDTKHTGTIIRAAGNIASGIMANPHTDSNVNIDAVAAVSVRLARTIVELVLNRDELPKYIVREGNSGNAPAPDESDGHDRLPPRQPDRW